MIDNSPLVRKLIALALEEDLSQGDITSNLTIERGRLGKGKIIARQKLCLCGMPLLPLITELNGKKIEIVFHKHDGEWLEDMEIAAELSGELQALLAVERTILNFLQRLSGIATSTAGVKEKAGELIVLDTRKTVPGHRLLEKYAVRTGGADNHRFNLGDMVLVKNNHIDANGGDIRATVEKVVANKPPYVPFEVEVRNIDELRAILTFSPDSIMLDNMDDETTTEAVRLIREHDEKVFIEASGNITPERFDRLRQAGVSGVSMGALTGKAGTVDLSLRIDVL